MPNIADSQLLPPKSWDAFEEMCADLFEREWCWQHTERYGRQGQRQNGIDIYGRKNGDEHSGVQCKGKAKWPPKKLTATEIDLEVCKALKFEPKLTELIFATTAENDVHIQDHIHSITEKHRTSGLFSVHVYWWSEITRRLVRHEDLIRKHFGYTQLGQVEQKIDALSRRIGSSFASSDIIDSVIKAECDRIRKSRFFSGFDRIEAADNLAIRILDGDLQTGAPSVQADALCWSARILIFDRTKQAEALISKAKSYAANNILLKIVEAFLVAAQGNRGTALRKISEIDTHTARSSAFFIASHGNTASQSLQWLSQSGYTPEDLDADGKLIFITKCVEVEDWQTALTTVYALHSQDFEDTPALLFVAGMTYLAQAIPTEYRSLVLQQIPFEADSFPLNSTTEMLEFCRVARGLFERCADYAEELNLVSVMNSAADYALWLGLRDPLSQVTYLEELRTSMSDERHSLRRINLAIRFGLPIDFAEATKEIDRQTTLTGGTSSDAAFARFALAFKLKSEADIVEYISKHRDQLFKHLDSVSVARLEIEMLSRSGQISLAEKKLDNLKNSGADENICLSLARMISEAKGSDAVFERIEEYESAPSIDKLSNLISLLEERNSFEQMAFYARILLKTVPSANSAKRLAKALQALGRTPDIGDMLREYSEFIDQSEYLKSLWCVCLFQEGNLKSAEKVLCELRSERDCPKYRDLTVRFAITSGDWDRLHVHVEEEWSAAELRSSEELIGIAQLAQAIQSPRTKAITRQAVKMAESDPNILLGAYVIAIKGGWEDDLEVRDWFKCAVENSSEDGPIQRVSLSELVERKPTWNKQEEDTWKKLKRCEVPIFGAAELLNRTLCDLFLIPALSNSLQLDPRKRSHIFSYSGTIKNISSTPRVVAFDATALLTLSILDITDSVLEFFDEVIIPHSTLGWLFEEKQHIQFHQPSRIRLASDLRSLLQDDRLQKFVSTAIVDPDLSAEVGVELAELLTVAKADTAVTGEQRLVVRSCPIHKVGSLMNEVADLSAYSDQLCSCLSIVEKLWDKGQLTASQYEKAKAYLGKTEQCWPDEPDISDGAILYLDSLAVDYLQHVDVLAKLKQAGFIAIVSRNESQDLSALLKYDNLANNAEKVIESLRLSLARGIKSKRIKIGPLPNEELEETDRFRLHPTVSILDVASISDAVIVDDRFINHHNNIESKEKLTPIFSSYDLLGFLLDQGAIHSNEFYEHTSILRNSGFMFMAPGVDELHNHLKAAKVINRHLQETAELKAIRENILQSRMSAALFLPKDVLWLAEFQKKIANTLRELWTEGTDIESNIAQSNWLLELSDLRGWSQSAGFLNGQALARGGYFTLILSLFRAQPETSKEMIAAYWKWLEQTVLLPLQDQDEDIFEELLDAAASTIAYVIDLNSEELPDE